MLHIENAARYTGGLKPFWGCILLILQVIAPLWGVKTSLCLFSIFFQIEQYYSAKLFCNLNDCIDKYKTTPHFFPMV